MERWRDTAMLRRELAFDMIDVLRSAMNRFLPELVRKTREILEPRDLKLFDRVFERYYGTEVGGRWYDRYHMPLDVLFSAKAVGAGQAPPETVVCGICHDIGYGHINSKLKVGGENKEDLQVVHLSRILHMQKAAGPTAEILMEHGYSSDEIRRIVDVVSSHDNGLIGIPMPEDPLFLAARDADRTLPMHPISFYKDWVGITNQQDDFSLLDLFRSRIITFYDDSDPAPSIWGRPEKLAREDEFCFARGSLHVPYTHMAREWRDRQFEARWYEIQQDILMNESVFRQYAEHHIQSEIAAGRG